MSPTIAVRTGLALPPAAFAAADLLNPGWSPAETMISYYVHAPHGGWLVPVGVLVLAGASAVLTRRAAADPRTGRAGPVLLGVWTVALIVAGVLPIDPPGRWDQPPTPAGALHATAALLAFAALPVAAVILSRGRVAGRLAIVSVAATAVFLVTFVDVLDGPTLGIGPWPGVTGLAERVMLGADIAWLAATAVRPARRPG